MDFEPFWPDDLEILGILYVIDGCPVINCVMAQ